MRCHPHPLATSDERFTTNATASSGRLAPTSAATVTRHGKPVRNLSASTTATSPASHNTPRQWEGERCVFTPPAPLEAGTRNPPPARRRRSRAAPPPCGGGRLRGRNHRRRGAE